MTFDEGLDVVLQILFGDIWFDKAFDDVDGDKFGAFKSGALNVMRITLLDLYRQILFPASAAIGMAARNTNRLLFQRNVVRTNLADDRIGQRKRQWRLTRLLRKPQMLLLRHRRLDGMRLRRGKGGI